MLNTFDAFLLRALPGPPLVLPQFARAACPVFLSDVDAGGCQSVDGLHSWSRSSEQAYSPTCPPGCSQVHTQR